MIRRSKRLQRHGERFPEALSDLASAIGRGLFAGAVGTAAMTASSTLETKLRGRAGSTAPADAAGAVLGVEPSSEGGKTRFAGAVHWGYGTAWGAARGTIAATGFDGARATAAHFGAVWGAALVALPMLGVAPPPWRWGAKELAIDAIHHAVYATSTGAAYAALDRS